MTRTEAMDAIKSALAVLDDEQIHAVADLVGYLAASEAARDLSPRELAQIERSKRDFLEGRTLSLDELKSFLDDRAGERAVVLEK